MTSSLPHPTYYCLENKFEFKIACLSRLLSNIFFKKDFILFLDRGEGREEERERNIDVWLLLVHPIPGTWPTTQACALTGYPTGNLLIHRLALSPLSHTSQGYLDTFEG